MRNVVIGKEYIYVPMQGTKSTMVVPITDIPNNDIDRFLHDFVPGGIVLLNRTDEVRVVRNKSVKKIKRK